MESLETIAIKLPGVDQGIACAGTALESRTYRVKKKTFLFVSATSARFKLSASTAEAKRLGCEVGSNGWVKLALEAMPSASVVRRWIVESHGLISGGPVAAKSRTRTKTTKRSKR